MALLFTAEIRQDEDGTWWLYDLPLHVSLGPWTTREQAEKALETYNRVLEFMDKRQPLGETQRDKRYWWDGFVCGVIVGIVVLAFISYAL